MSGRRNGRTLVVCITATTDQRRIADSARIFVLCAARRRSGRKVALTVQRHCADGAEISHLTRVRGPSVGFMLRNQIFWIAKSDPMLERELLCSVAGDQHVFALFENDSGKPNGIANPL